MIKKKNGKEYIYESVGDLKTYNLSFEKLKELTKMGIPGRECYYPKTNRKLIPGALYKGRYLGSPGRDIFFFLPKAKKGQTKSLAQLLAKQFPKKPPSDHTGFGACIRYIYGQFDKQGILLSNIKCKQMIEEKPDWSFPEKFINILEKELCKLKKDYGLALLNEMIAHREGDKVVVFNDNSQIKKMEKRYNRAIKYSFICYSYKQMFTPYFWCAKYFNKFGDAKKSLHYSLLCIENMKKYCPDGRRGYIGKALWCFLLIKSLSSKSRWEVIVRSSNRCGKRAILEALKITKKYKDINKLGKWDNV